jgi:hypothetical protein
MGDDDDATAAELEYLKARELELMEQNLNLEKQLGMHLDRTTAGQVVREIADALRRSGNETLAVKYVSAFDRWQIAHDACLQRIALGEVSAPVQDAMDDALDEFERVAAEANAWLDEKGGAQ